MTTENKIDVYLDLKTVTESNTGGHWSKKYKRASSQSKTVWLELLRISPSGSIKLPCIVTMTRYGIFGMDDDNLISSFKHIRDSIADFLIPGLPPGKADDDKRIKWVCLQIPVNQRKDQKIRIQIEEI